MAKRVVGVVLVALHERADEGRIDESGRVAEVGEGARPVMRASRQASMPTTHGGNCAK